MVSLTRTKDLSDGAYLRRRNFFSVNKGAWDQTHGQSYWTDQVTFDPYTIRDFREIIRRRESATTSLVGTKRTHNVPTSLHLLIITIRGIGVDKEYWGAEIDGTLGVFISDPNLPSSDFSSVDNRAKSVISKKILSAQRDLQGLVVLGELGQTLRLIRNPAKAFFEYTSDYLNSVLRKSKGLKTRSKMRRMVANEWLAYRFGVLPLLSDVESAGFALRRFMKDPMPTKVVSGFSVEQQQDEPGQKIPYAYGLIRFNHRQFIQAQKSVRYKVCVALPQTQTDIRLSALGFKYRDFVPSLWELVPWSFLIDYFSNIGDIIGALSIQSADIRWAERGTSTFIEKSIRLEDLEFLPQTGWQVDELLSKYDDIPVKRREIVTRDVYNASFVPSLRFEIPGLGMKWLNIAALATLNVSALRSLR
jgi:hypothetical protein